MALHVGDDPRRVRENRRLVFDVARINPDKAVIAQQVHGSTAALVDENDSGCGTISHTDAVPGADGLVTRERGLPLMGFSADCMLMALADESAGVLGLLHAGWRGMAGGIIQNTISIMQKAGADLSRLSVIAGPSIGPCCFEVGMEVAEKLGTRHMASRNESKAMYDLRAAAHARLLDCGVHGAQIRIETACTCCREDVFFSHRRTVRNGEKHTGRMAMIVWMERE